MGRPCPDCTGRDGSGGYDAGLEANGLTETTTATTHPADRLVEAVQACRAPVCVGIDPVLERLPTAVRSCVDAPEAAVESIDRFTQELLDALAGVVPCVKFQSACYERYGADGVRVLDSCMARARELGLHVVFDAKRGDIGISNQHYAAAFHRSGADWITLNGYLGIESLEPYLAAGHGGFVLVRTSNPEGTVFQDGGMADGRTVAESLADLVVGTDDRLVGDSGYSSLGVVVGATQGDAHRRLRDRLGRQVFLVPGYGAQGAGLDDVLELFHADGLGALITASRSVIYAAGADDPSWAAAAADAANSMAEELGRAVGLRAG